MAHALLEGLEHCLLVAGLDIDHSPCRKPDLSDCWREQILACHAPKHLALRPRHDARREQRGRGSVDSSVAAAGDFVKCPHCQAAAGKVSIDHVDAERQGHALGRRATFEALYALAEIRNHGIVGGKGHFGS